MGRAFPNASCLDQFPESDLGKYEDAFDALKQKSLFNIVDYKTLWKIDFIVKQPTPFDASRFARREVVAIAGVHLYAASAEDILITKLWWAKLGESDLQLRDAAGIIQVQRDRLDIDYVERWVAVLELERQFEMARELAG